MTYLAAYWLVLVLVKCSTALECPAGTTDENCILIKIKNGTQQNTSQEMTSTTPKLVGAPKSLNMLAEDQMLVFQSTMSPQPKNWTNSTEEPKGRALNFTMANTSNVLSPNASAARDDFGDLSDVTIGDDEEDDDEVGAKILTPKSSSSGNATSTGMCEKGDLTYEDGETLEIRCESVCTCRNGKMECVDRCARPFFRKGKRIDDPLCSAKDVADPCCAILVCASDTEVEPLEICSHNNTTYNRGDSFHKGCDEICTCESMGKISCKTRCPPVNKTSDKCVEVPDPNDACCKKVLCDVTLDDHEDNAKHKIISARFLNSTTIMVKFDSKLDDNSSMPLVEISNDKTNWTEHQISPGGLVAIKNTAKFLRLQNTDDSVDIQNIELGPKQVGQNKDHLPGCSYRNSTFKLGEEYNDNCSSLCVCNESGMKCLNIECPTYFGVDVLDPNCVEWETIPPDFVPSPPNCCPDKLQCKNNGSCSYQGHTFQNWQQLPINITGCKKRCYCEMGKVDCQDTCPPVTAVPPPTLPCLPHQAVVDHLPEDDCCMYWVCNTQSNQGTGRNETNNDQNEIQTTTDTLVAGPIDSLTTKAPSNIFGPLLIYENKDKHSSEQNPLNPYRTPEVSPVENPFNKNKPPTKNKNDENYMGPINPINKKPLSDTKISNNPKQPKLPQKTKPSKDGLFVTPPTQPKKTPNAPPASSQDPHTPQVLIHGTGNANELLHFINQHPEIANYPPGSVVEIHNITPNQKNIPQLSNFNGVAPATEKPQNVPYVFSQSGNDLPPGVTLEQIIQEIHKNPHTNSAIFSNHPQFTNGQYLLAPQTRPTAPNRQSSHQKGGLFGGHNIADYQNEVSVHTLEAIDPHTVRLAFMVPPVIVGLHGRVEVRYTYHNDDDVNSWELQVFAPPSDLIATPQLEFDLLDLKADTEYKIKITITLRDLNNAPTSRVYKIKTPKESATLPSMIPIEPELAITDVNATWATAVWRKFSEYELQFIDGVQLRFKEIDGKIYDATPLIHRSVTSYTLENLKPNSRYEMGIFFIPFPGQVSELHTEHMVHFTTANEVDTYGFNVTLDIGHIKSTSVEIVWSGVPYPEDKYVNIYRAIYQSDSGKEDHSSFKIAKRDAPTKTVITDLKPGTRYRLWLEVYLTNGKIKTSNVQDFSTKPRAAPALGASSQQGEQKEGKGDYYGPLVIVAILASIAIMSTLVLLLILVRRHNQNKAAITPPARVSQSAYDNPTYKVEIQQETMGL